MLKAVRIGSVSKAAVCLAMALLVLILGVLFCSPVHRHDPHSRQACMFSQFEHGGFSGPPAIADTVVALPSRWQEPADDLLVLPSETRRGVHAGRAPPNGPIPHSC
jgi:hypothetical protein